VTDRERPPGSQELLQLIARLVARRWYQQQMNERANTDNPENPDLTREKTCTIDPLTDGQQPAHAALRKPRKTKKTPKK